MVTRDMDRENRHNGERQTTGLQCITDRNQIVRDYMWLVKCVAKGIAERLPSNVDIDDLISAGTVGLIKAAEDYDPSRGTKFETYARYRIRGAILDDLRKADNLPYSARAKIKQITRAIERLERNLGRHPTDEEIAEAAGISVSEIPMLLAEASTADLYSLEEMLDVREGEGSVTSEDLSKAVIDPLSRLEKEELEKVLIDAIKSLPRTERLVLGLYYYEGLRMKEIGEVLGITESRVSQIHSRAILLLRGKLRAHIVE